MKKLFWQLGLVSVIVVLCVVVLFITSSQKKEDGVQVDQEEATTIVDVNDNFKSVNYNVGEIVFIDQTEFLIAQVIKLDDARNFTLLVNNTISNQKYIADFSEEVDMACFNGDTYWGKDASNIGGGVVFAIWGQGQLINYDNQVGNELGYAPNGCIQVVKWSDNQLIISRQFNGNQEVLAYSFNDQSLKSFYHYWQRIQGGLDEQGDIYHIWQGEKALLVQIEHPDGIFSPLYTESVNAFSEIDYSFIDFELDHLAYDTDKSVSTDLLSDINLDGVMKGLTFTIEDQYIFVGWGIDEQ